MGIRTRRGTEQVYSIGRSEWVAIRKHMHHSQEVNEGTNGGGLEGGRASLPKPPI